MKDKILNIIKTPFIVLILLVLIAGSVLYTKNISDLLTSETKTQVVELTQQRSTQLKSRFNAELKNIETISRSLGATKDISSEEANSIINSYNMDGKTEPFTIVDLDGNALTKRNSDFIINKQDYFRRTIDGESVVSELIYDKDKKNSYVVIATPIQQDHEIVGLLQKVIPVKNIEKRLNDSLKGTDETLFIVDKKTNIIVTNDKSKNNRTIKDYMNNADTNVDEELFKTIDKAITGNAKGLQSFKKDRRTYYLSYSPIQMDNCYYLISIMPKDLAAQNSSYVTTITFIVCLILMLDFIAVLLFLVYSRRKQKEQLEEVAFKDILTGGMNLTYFNDFASKVVKDRTKNIAFVYFDVDNFKTFNNIFGYAKGDILLKYIFNRISIDLSNIELIVRASTDNFVCLLEYKESKDVIIRMEALGEELKEFEAKLSEPFPLTLCCGIYYLEEEDKDIREMQDKAILAQKSIKGHGVKNIAFYDASIKKRDLELKELENNMHRALDNDEFKVYLQPKVNLIDGRIVGAEALIRWINKNDVMIQPDDFIPLFEKNGFVTEIDFFVFEQVCKLLKEWISLGRTDLKIAVNLSRLHLYNLDFADRFERIRIKYNVPASYIQFELTESAVFDNLNIIKDICYRLKALGFGVAMDDFGSGYSSLNLLSSIPVDLLKLDCKFLSDNVATKKGRIVIESIIKMASELNITVLCEGVETLQQVEFLKEVKCTLAQGFYYDKGLPISEFETKYIKEKE